MATKPKADSSKPEVKSVLGRSIKYSDHGDECEIIGYALDDLGLAFTFKRAGREYPLRLSAEGAKVLSILIQDIFWLAPPVGKTEGQSK